MDGSTNPTNPINIIVVAPHSYCKGPPYNICMCDERTPETVEKFKNYIEGLNSQPNNNIKFHTLEVDTPRSVNDYNREATRYTPWREEFKRLVDSIPGTKYLLEVHSYPNSADTAINNTIMYLLPIANRVRDAQQLFTYLKSKLKNPTTSDTNTRIKRYKLVKQREKCFPINSSRVCIYPGSDKNDLQYEFREYSDLFHVLLEFNEDSDVLTTSMLDTLVEQITNFVIDNPHKIVPPCSDNSNCISTLKTLFGPYEGITD